MTMRRAHMSLSSAVFVVPHLQLKVIWPEYTCPFYSKLVVGQRPMSRPTKRPPPRPPRCLQAPGIGGRAAPGASGQAGGARLR